MQPPAGDARKPCCSRGRLIVVLFATVVLALLVILHVKNVNGPSYWRWNWQQLPAIPLWPMALAAVVPFFIGQILYHKNRARLFACLGLVMLTNLGLQLVFVGAQSQPFSLRRIIELVENPYIYSYFTAAAQVDVSHLPVQKLLERYPAMVAHFFEHARLKPPGQVLYHLAFIKLLGLGHAAAMTPALLLGIIATVSVPAVYWMIRRFTADGEAAFAGASFFALCPSLIVFYPTFDQWYPILSCAMAVTWGAAIHGGDADQVEASGAARRRMLSAAAFGVILAVGLFLSWAILFVGVFLGGYALREIAATHPRETAVRRVLLSGFIALLVAGTLYWILYLASGYPLKATFDACYDSQSEMQQMLNRPDVLHIPFDLLDFALGLGWIGAVLIALFFLRSRKNLPPRSKSLALLGVIQVGVVACTSFIPAETARVWLPLTPFVLLPIGIELSRWTVAHRQIVYICLLTLLCLLGQNMMFVDAPHVTVPLPLPTDDHGHVKAGLLLTPFMQSKQFKVKD